MRVGSNPSNAPVTRAHFLTLVQFLSELPLYSAVSSTRAAHRVQLPCDFAMISNPRFVEDIIREAAVQLQEDPRVAWFRIHVQNCESIHSHDVFATIEHSR